MGGPSKQDYAPTASEKMQASVAKAQYDRNKRLFAPVQKAFVASAEQNLNPTFRGIANADTAQALNPLSDYGVTTGVAEGGALYAAAMTNPLRIKLLLIQRISAARMLWKLYKINLV